ncbi:MAG: hypothetical protein J5I81_07160 [Nitrococcus mobilis]|nr:hypothetical protein [Nitrococcus mobilis]
MNLNLMRCALPWVILALVFSAPVLADDVTEEAISMQDLPPAVASTVQSELGDKQAEEVEKISYEGIVVLYEAEYHQNGEEYEVYVYPNGELAARHSHEQEEEGR